MVGMIGAHIGVTETFDWARIETWADAVHGNSSILFALIAGVSIALLTGGASRPSTNQLAKFRLQLVGRAAVVFSIGVALELLNSGIAVILAVYGLLFVAVIPFLRLQTRSLFVLAGGLAILGPPLLETLRLVSLQATGPGLDLALFGTYPITVWLALMLAGLAIGRCDLSSLRTAGTILIGGITLASGAFGLASAISLQNGDSSSYAPRSETSTAESGGTGASVPITDLANQALTCNVYPDKISICFPEGTPNPMEFGANTNPGAPYLDQLLSQDIPGQALAAMGKAGPHSGGTLEILGSGGLAMAVLGACLVLGRFARPILLPVAALGSMPLTVYALHVIAIVLASGLDTDLLEGNRFWLILTLVLMVGAAIWSSAFGTGPLERLTKVAADAMALTPRPGVRTHRLGGPGNSVLRTALAQPGVRGLGAGSGE
ncbi:DUF418 domain-containing protein [Pseudoclavibacter sp. VKM Ac-2888]|nr:DUF418 domain-containing protein [Pseudoclavibacter sp. VKM Ac-2888]